MVVPRFTTRENRFQDIFNFISEFQNQLNEQTGFIDGSQVYGTSQEEMMDLRTGTAGTSPWEHLHGTPRHTTEKSP